MRGDAARLHTWILDQIGRCKGLGDEALRLKTSVDNENLYSVVDLIQCTGTESKHRGAQREWDRIAERCQNVVVKESMGRGKKAAVISMESFIDHIVPHLRKIAPGVPIGGSGLEGPSETVGDSIVCAAAEVDDKEMNDSSMPIADNEFVQSEPSSSRSLSTLDEFPLLRISFDGGTIRHTAQGLYSTYDVIRVVSGTKNPQQIWDNIVSQHQELLWQRYHFPGQGQRSTPVANRESIVKILNYVPGHTAAVFRAEKLEDFIRLLESKWSLDRDVVQSEPSSSSSLTIHGDMETDDSPLGISFDGATVRHTADGLYSLYDVIKVVHGSANPWQVWNEIRKKEPSVNVLIKLKDFPGQGQRSTPVADIRGIFRILDYIPGRKAAAFRAKKSDSFLRMLGADPALIDELVARRQAMDADEEHPHHVFDTAVEAIAAEQAPNRSALVFPTLTIRPAIGNNIVTMSKPHLYSGLTGTNCGVDEATLGQPRRPFAIIKVGVCLGSNDRSRDHVRTYAGFEVLDRFVSPADSPAEILIKRYLREKGLAVAAQVPGKASRETECFIVYDQEQYNEVMEEIRQLIDSCNANLETTAVKIEQAKVEQEREKARAEEAKARTKAEEIRLRRYELAATHCPEVLRELLLSGR